jgi:hypothetical protein
MQLKMDPQSSQSIPARSVDSVRQKVHIKNPNQVGFDDRVWMQRSPLHFVFFFFFVNSD